MIAKVFLLVQGTQCISYLSIMVVIHYCAVNFCGPDFFLVKDVEPAKRNSWVVWEEAGRYPDLIIEILSDSTAKTDRVDKKQLYQNIFRTPEYFWSHPCTLEFQGFQLSKDMVYEPLPDVNGMKWSNALQMYLGIHNQKLRFYAQDHSLIPTLAESTQIEHEQAEIERRRAEALATKLQELGIDPTTISV